SDAKGRFDRARKCKAQGHRRIPGYPSDDACSLLQVGTDEQAIDAFVDVAEPLLQSRHGLAIGSEAEMAGLDDPGGHRSHGDLVQTFTDHRLKVVGGRVGKIGGLTRSKRRAQAPRAMVEPRPRIGSAVRAQSEQIADRALEPDGWRMARTDR